MSGKPNRGRGRPAASKKFKLVPIPHAKPDHRKLGRAFLALAVHRAQETAGPDVKPQEANDGKA